MEIKTICSFTMCSFDFVCSGLNFFDRCARSPRDFWKYGRSRHASLKALSQPFCRFQKIVNLQSSCRRGATAGKNQFGAKTAFQNQASAKQSQTFESCLSVVLEYALFSGRNQFVRRTFTRHLLFSRYTRKEQSCSI